MLKRNLLITFYGLLLLSPFLLWAHHGTEAYFAEQRCRQLIESYPEAIQKTRLWKNEVILKNGKAVLCNDGKSYNLSKPKEYLKQINNVDLSDVLLQSYPSVYSAPIFEPNYSPGRFRNDQLLLNTYINIDEMSEADQRMSRKDKWTSKELKTLSRSLEKEIVSVPFLNFTISMNQRNGAAQALRNVHKKLTASQLTPSQKADVTWLSKRNMADSFRIRPVGGTNRLSSHSWGIAIDFMVKHSTPKLQWFDSYWKWVGECLAPLACPQARSSDGMKTRASLSESQLKVAIYEEHFDHFPQFIIDTFAAEGFIWAGHWNHFDTMHFEYRPEFFK